MSSVPTFMITDWLFSTARGNYEIDLGESCAQIQDLADIAIDRSVILDYTQDRGSTRIRGAIAGLYAGACTADGVMVSHGGQEALYLLYRTLLNPGDHVITTAPGWQQSWEIPEAAGCSVTSLRWQPGDPFDADALRAAIRPETVLVVLSSPGNPSGRALTEAEWSEIVAVLERSGAWLLSDEEFEPDLSRSSIGRYSRCVSVSSLSKIYGLPGLRVGWAATPSAEGRELLERMVNYKRYITLANSPISELLALEILSDLPAQRERYTSLLREGIRTLRDFAETFSGSISLVPPDSTPFAWINLKAPISSIDLAKRLLDEHHVFVMPAEVFGGESGFRLTYTREPAVLTAGLDRLGELLKTVS